MERDDQLMKSLINKLSIGVVIADQQGQLLFTNQTIKEMTGYTEAEIRTMEDWYKKAYPDPESRKKAKKFFQYDIENDIQDRTYKITTAAGKYKYFNFRYSQLDDGKMLFEIIDISHRIKQKQELKNQKIIFENLFTNSLEGIVLLDSEFRILDANNKFEEIFEISKSDIKEEFALDAVSLYEEPENIEREINAILEKEDWENEVRFKVNNKIKYCNVHIFSVDNKEHDRLIYVAVDDITESKEREKELKEVKERLELAVSGANIGIWDWNVEEENIHFNENWAKMLGYELSELENNLNTWLNLVHPDDKEQALKDLENHLEGKTEKYYNEHRLKTKSGSWKWIRDIGKVTERDEAGNAIRIVGVHIDIDREKRAAAEIEYLSNHDELTGLYNRRYFNEELKRLSNSRKYPISIIVGDMNGLKDINDNYGHSMGDRYIKRTAEAIKSSVRTEDVVARIGGDEFAIILPETDYSKADDIVDRILKRIEEDNKIEELPVPLTIALGFETTDCSNQKHSVKNIRKCYNKADEKMYEQKFAGRC
ncbi:PAS domain S-box-containing protein/diguanylate cyclase (GGDEF)-like protein [Halanaerobium congolense]|uniref:PAS domain S-box-containing protein/diguanylate cyclase (GGDEF)-like protein n=1 Tax=Halanaerobium congolense TaxID=54121 RepID=A0A4V3GVI6_9FIRM|nr:sensor domain-containing diguanylate cyclase [Halanaerobium congolense]TDX38300.1 PAS domain S-box-containing protein/diguanylate cyclase (GGDEF)-like protein [Halanaerobium congolense]